MNADLPRDPALEPALDPALERLIAGLDQAAELAGGATPDTTPRSDDALVTAVMSQLRSEATWDGPPDHLRASILGQARSEATSGVPASSVPATSVPATNVPDASVPAPPARTAPRDVPRTVPRQRSVPVPRWRRMAWAVPMTAVAAVAFTLLVLGGQRLLTSPDNGTAYALAGGSLAPAATGTVSVSSAPGGFPVVLDAHNLPGAPVGYYYQAWLIKAGQQPVSLGTFHGRKTGQPIKLWSGVDPAGYELTVNLQSLTDPPGPTRQVALTAQITN